MHQPIARSLFALLLVAGLAFVVASASPMGQSCDVVWDSPSADWRGSMPLGNGDIGLNAWVEPSGDLIFYISKTDAWDEIMRLVKVGRVRVRLTPNPVAPGAPFEQALRLEEGAITIAAGPAGAQTRLRLWVDANHPVIRLEVESDAPVALEAALELWRTEDRKLNENEFWGAYAPPNALGMGGPPDRFVSINADTLVDRTAQDRLVWFHRNGSSYWREIFAMQGMDELAGRLKDPVLGQTFGGVAWGENLIARTSTTLASARPSTRQSLAITLLREQTDTPAQWIEQAERQADALRAQEVSSARAAHADWWRAFWDRSWILLPASNPAADPSTALDEIDLAGKPIRFGVNSDVTGYYLKGDLARVRISRGVFTPEQVAAAAAWRGEAPSATEDAAAIGDWIFDSPVDGAYPSRVNPNTPARIVGETTPTLHDGLRAVRLAGAGHLEVAPDPSLAHGPACTLEAWVAPDADVGPGAQLLSNTFAGQTMGYLLGFTDSRAGWTQFNRWTLSGQPPTPVAGGAWTHYAATIDLAGEQRLYVNGALIGTSAIGYRSDVSRGYALQRFMLAAAGRGARPIKFNGSIFNMGPDGPGADYRMWGGPYWQQNTRLVYWPMLAAGDFDLMQPWFRMFLDTLPVAEARARYFYDQGGAFFPEVMWWFGTLSHTDYGWNRPVHLKKNEVMAPATFRHFTGNTELLTIMLERYQLTRDAAFLRDELLPLAVPILQFFAEQFPPDASGRRTIDRAQALETYYGQVNPANEVAGLWAVLDGLLALPADALDPALRAQWTALRASLPPVPVCEQDGLPLIAISDVLCRNQGYETPELYPVFPFRLFGVGRPDLERARNTYAGASRGAVMGWNQQAIMAACLGLTAEARRHVAWRFALSNPEMRFPAFWGPNYDWTPDMDHGCVGMVALQNMLLQNVGRRILLFPAWPAEWDVDFRLHAGENTVVTGSLRAGRLAELSVDPPQRLEDIEVLLNQSSE